MQNWERSEFDEQWKDAFAGAEVAPSSSIWASVDRDLTLADNNEGKRRIIFYQRLAAACVLFAVAAGGFGLYHWKQSEPSVAKVSPGKTGTVKSPGNSKPDGNSISSQGQAMGVADSSAEKNRGAKSNPSETTEVQSQSKTATREKSGSMPRERLTLPPSNQGRLVKSPARLTAKTPNKKEIVGDESELTRHEKMAAGISEELNSARVDDSSKTDKWLASTADLPSLVLLPLPEIQSEPRFAEIYRQLPYIPAAFMNENHGQKFEHEKLWASVTAASGAYTESAGSSYNSSAALKIYASTFAQSSPTLNNSGSYTPTSTGSAPTIGRSYSYGVLGGVRLTERWVLQTGVQYMNQTMGSSTSQYANYGSGSLISTNEFVSVPVQAGYLLINRKMGWQINPGLSTDFFVRNTLSNQQLSMSQGAGTDSPYRSVNFAGLVSSEFSYKLGKNYRLSVVPGMRYSFNPALKSVATGNGIAWDVGFRFRYIFK